MKQKRWQAVVVIAFAWVLWSENTPKKKGGGIIWTPEEAYETKLDCEIKKDWQIHKALERKAELIGSTGGSTGWRDSAGTTILHCFPQDFDPRPRK